MILVTGGTGLVGGHLLWHLLQNNDHIVAIRRKTSNIEPLRKIFSSYTEQPELYLDRICWRTADVLDISSLNEAFENIEEVYHCAAMVSLGKGSDELLKINITGTKNIVDASLKSNIRRFCFVSSIAACGRATTGKLIDENCTWDSTSQLSAYSKSKYLSEQEVWKGIENGLNAVIVNPGVILGYSGNEKGSSQLFAQVRKGLIFYTLGGTGYICVKDVVKAMMILTKSNVTGERYILISENRLNKDILWWIADGFQKPRPWINVGYRTIMFVGFIMEYAGKFLGFNPLIDRNSGKTAISVKRYSNKKFSEEFNFSFTPVKDCILDICSFLRNQE